MANKSNNMTNIFEIGNTYSYRFVGDSSLIVNCKIVARTAKFITIQEEGEKRTKRLKVHEDKEGEFARIGHYSMAPVLRAKRIVEEPEAKKAEPKAKPIVEEPEDPSKGYINPTFLRETGCYLFYEYLGVEFKVTKRNSIFAVFTKCLEIDREFAKMCNDIASGK